MNKGSPFPFCFPFLFLRHNRVCMQSEKTNHFIVFLLVLGSVSCASKRDVAHDHQEGHHIADETVWKEMDDFHIVMAETFHPYKDSANLDPAKSRVLDLMTAADQWSSARIPDRVDNSEMRSKLRQLKAEAAKLAESVKSGNDKVIGEQLNQLHDTFHQIQEAWYEPAAGKQ